MSDQATLSSKFQISIPKAIRHAQQWEAGQKFTFLPKGAAVMLVPIPDRKTLSGFAKGARAEAFRDREDRF